MNKPRSEYDKVTDSRRRYVMQGIRFAEPKASEVAEDIAVIAGHHGDKTTAVVEAIRRERKRVDSLNKK